MWKMVVLVCAVVIALAHCECCLCSSGSGYILTWSSTYFMLLDSCNIPLVFLQHFIILMKYKHERI